MGRIQLHHRRKTERLSQEKFLPQEVIISANREQKSHPGSRMAFFMPLCSTSVSLRQMNNAELNHRSKYAFSVFKQVKAAFCTSAAAALRIKVFEKGYGEILFSKSFSPYQICDLPRPQRRPACKAASSAKTFSA